MENRQCKENTRQSFGDHTKGFSRNYKSSKSYIIRSRCSFSKRSLKSLANLASANVDMKKNSEEKPHYRKARDQSSYTNMFQSKTKSLAIVYQHYRYMILARDQVFFIYLLLIDIKHHTVSDYSWITNLANLTNLLQR